MEEFEGSGRINIIKNIEDGKGKRVASRFLNNLFEAFVRQSATYIDEVREAPFAYGEMQLNSIMAPALSTVTDAFLMDSPVAERRLNKRGKLGWDAYSSRADYWCRLSKFDFLVELKHDFHSLKKDTIKSKTREKWNTMNIQPEEARNHAGLFSKFSKGVFLTTFHIITLYDHSEDHSSRISPENHYRLRKTQMDYMDIDPEPNWNGLWVLDNGLYNHSYWEVERQNVYYPGVLFLARIGELIGR